MVAEPAEGQEKAEPAPLGALTTEIVTAYVTKNAVATAALGHVIETVGRELAALGREEPKRDTAKPKLAVPVRRSIRQDQLVCLVCGKRLQTLRRHLDRAHQLTPETYRERFGLKPDYPMLAPDYAPAAFRGGQAGRPGTAYSGSISRPGAAQRRVILRQAARVDVLGERTDGLHVSS